MLGAVSKNRPEAERSTGPQTWQVPKGVQGGGPPALARFRDFVSKSRPQLLRAMHQLWENISTSDKVAGSAIDVIRNQASVSPPSFLSFSFSLRQMTLVMYLGSCQAQVPNQSLKWLAGRRGLFC